MHPTPQLRTIFTLCLTIVVSGVSVLLLLLSARQSLNTNFNTPLWGITQVTHAVVLCISMLGTAAALWQFSSALLALFALQSHNSLSLQLLRRVGTPLTRRIVFGAAAASLIATPATAATLPSSLDVHTQQASASALFGAEANDDVTWGAVDNHPENPQPASHESASDDASTESVLVVSQGDCLWALSARLLGEEATDAEITQAWQLLYEQNRQTIGANPNLIFPGTTLTVPDALSTPTN